MKRNVLLLLACMAVLVSCAKSPQQIAEQKVKEFMSEALKDPSSYEPVSFSPIDTIFTHFEDTQISKDFSGAEYDIEYWMRRRDSKEFKENYPDASVEDSIAKYISLSKSLEQDYYEAKNSFKQEISQFYVEHIYRAKNGFGALDKDRIVIYFNKDFEIVGTNK